MLLFGKPNVKKMKESKDIEGLLKALDYGKGDRGQEVNEAAAEALAQIGDINTVNRLIQSEFYTYGTELALVRFGVLAVEPLIAAFENRKDMRDDIIRILAKIGDPRAAYVLIPALKDVSKNTREWATDGLVRIGNPRAADVLIPKLIDESKYTRQYATDALVSIGNPVIESLKAALSDERTGMCDAAENVLRKIRTPEASEAIPSFLRRKSDKEYKMLKQRMIEDGDELPDGEYYERIRKLTYDDQRKKLTQELIKIGRPVIPSLIISIRYFKHGITASEKIHKEDPASEHFEWQVEAEKYALDSVVTILKEITGKDFGYSSQSWKKWWQQENKNE